MNNTLKTVLVVGGAVLAYTAFAKSTAGGNLIFYPGDIHQFGIKGASPFIDLSLRIQNTSGQKFVVKSFAANVYSNNQLIGNVEQFSPQEVYPNSATNYKIRLNLSPIGIVTQLFDALDGGPLNFQLEINGFANVDNFQQKVSIKYKIGS